MSEYAQSLENHEVRTELYGCSKNRREWVIELLDALARYPSQNETYFADYDTISVGRPIDTRNSPFTAILLAPPEPDDPEATGEIVGLASGSVFVHRVIGIHDSECDFAIANGGEELFKQLLALKCSLLLDEIRPNAK